MNQVNLIGFTGKDPIVTTNGKKVARISLATEDGYYDQQKSEFVKNTNWHSIIGWRKMADKIGELKKGDKIFVSGVLISRTWERNEIKQTVVEVEIQELYKIESIKKAEEKEEKPFMETLENDDLPF